MADLLSPEYEDRTAGSLDVDDELVDDIRDLLEADQRGMVLNVVADLYPADLARLLSYLPFDDARRFFHWLPTGQASEVLAELDGGYRAALLDEVRPERIAALIDELETDDAADVLADLPEEVVQQVMAGLEDAEDVQELLAYPEDTAGGIMGTEFVSVLPEWSVAEATEEVRRNAEESDNIYAVYVANEAGRLLGVVSLRDLLLSPSHVRIGEIMDGEPVAVRTDMDQEAVARVMERYDLAALPVIDADNRLVGRITFDDVMDVIREEAEEDIRLISGVSVDEGPSHSIWRSMRGRLPWLLVGLLGTMVSGSVLKGFEATLEQSVTLVFFIPIVMGMGGNAAVQSAGIAVQSLTSGEARKGDLAKRLRREIPVALLNGLALGLLLSAVILAIGQAGFFNTVSAERLALTVGLTMLTVTLLATTNGAVVPYVLDRMGVDPASSMGPFVTVLNDIIGLTVYFIYASVLFLR